MQEDVEAKLYEWHQLYQELEQAQSEMVLGTVNCAEATQAARTRIARLQHETQTAMDVLRAALERKRSYPK